MAETPRKYSGEMVHEFYTNYYSTLENNALTRKVVKKEQVLDMVWVRACLVDISERTISRFLFGNGYEALVLILEYDYRMEALKKVKQLSTKDKLMHFWWMANIITKAKEDAEWVISGKPISKTSLNFLAKSRWSIIRHKLALMVKNNILSADQAALMACIMSKYVQNIPRIIAIEIRERIVKDHTTILFSSLIFHLCRLDTALTASIWCNSIRPSRPQFDGTQYGPHDLNMMELHMASRPQSGPF
ncbi:hypothetical protein HAX54_006785 [Datura stramonium]|uniref:Putative plant transposon protein domain-containing protein n=1 Tax=Datura stramonium TaxID=4076 RepID=A0ABS8TAU6_DATST|nr:hypothetical protein [Datura stramonium]